MLKTLGVIEVRAHDQQNPSLNRKLGGKSILEWVVRRATDCERLDKVVVIASGAMAQQDVLRLVPADVPLLNFPHLDPLAALVATLGQYQAQALVHIGADHPFVDPVLIDRLMITADSHPECDYIGYCRRDQQPAILNHLGLFAEWCSAAALARAHSAARRPGDRHNVTAFVYGHPESFQVRLIPLPAELDREDLRLKIDGEEEWEHAQAIYEALGHEECDWRSITGLLHSQPALRHRMAHLNRAKQPA